MPIFHKHPLGKANQTSYGLRFWQVRLSCVECGKEETTQDYGDGDEDIKEFAKIFLCRNCREEKLAERELERERNKIKED